MNRHMASLPSLLLTFSVGVASAWLSRPPAPAPQRRGEAPAPTKKVEAPPREFALVIPQGTWEPIFFESVNERAKMSKLPILRARLPEGDMELRVWGGFGLTRLEGFRLRRAGARWSASYLGSDFHRGSFVDYERGLAQPKSGWEGAWSRLLNLGVMELPDAESAGCSAGVNDGYSYVVETNVNGVYRTYMYDNPDYSKCDEARRMLSIAEAVADEFGVEEFRPGKGSQR